MTQGDDDADCVGEIEAGTQQLRAEMGGPEDAQVAGQDGAQEQDEKGGEADAGGDLVGGEVRSAGDLEACVGEHPEGVAGQG